MQDNNNSIHQFDYSLICEYFASLHRQGPGSDTATLRALSFLPVQAAGTQIIDIGCGTGASTMVLAHATNAHITAVDLFEDFLTILNNKATAAGIGHRVTAQKADMNELPFADESFDVVWSEGAIYNVGFQRGISLWRRLIKPDGYLVVSEATWSTVTRPQEIQLFWEEAYPEIDLVSAKVKHLEEAGYQVIATFQLPYSAWEDFYRPAQAAQQHFLESHPENATATELVANQRHEAEMFGQYHQYYGYAFFIAKKVG